MTNANGFIDRAARRAQALPMARIVAAMLGVSAAFFALAMPARIVGGLLGLNGMPGAVAMAGQLVFAILFAGLAAAAGWLAMTVIAGGARSGPIVRLPALLRKRPVAAGSSDPAPTLRRGDAHPDAPPRRPIFAKDDLGTPFDEIVTDRRIIRGAPEAEFATPDAPIDLNGTIVSPLPATEAIVAEATGETAADEPQAATAAAGEVAADEADGRTPAPEPRADIRPAAPREGDSIAALMARFEGGLGQLGSGTLPPPDLSSLATLTRKERNPDEALRDALEALQRTAARQR